MYVALRTATADKGLVRRFVYLARSENLVSNVKCVFQYNKCGAFMEFMECTWAGNAIRKGAYRE